MFLDQAFQAVEDLLAQMLQHHFALHLSVLLFFTHAVNNKPVAIAAQIKSFLFIIVKIVA